MEKCNRSDLVVRVRYAEDAQRAEAALVILQQGFHRGLLKVAQARKSPAVPGGDL